MRACFRLASLAGALAATVPASARADATSAEREAQARFEEGIARVKANNFEGARISFTQAYAVLRKPAILWNLALAEEKSGHTLDALAHFKQFASSPQSGDDRASVDKHVAALTGRVGRLEVIAPVGAQIVVDGDPAGVAPWPSAIDVAPGRHHVEARTAQGTKDADTDVLPGEIAHVTLVAAAEPFAASSVAAPPASAILPPVAETSRADAGGPLHEPPVPRVVTVVALGTGAAVSAALGAYFALQSQAEKSTGDGFRAQYPTQYCSEVAPGSSTCVKWNNAVEAQNRDATLSNVFYVAGGVLTIGALVTWLLWPNEGTPSKAARVVPTLAVGGAGLDLAGRF